MNNTEPNMTEEARPAAIEAGEWDGPRFEQYRDDLRGVRADRAEQESIEGWRR
jgi:hypothetical protein